VWLERDSLQDPSWDGDRLDSDGLRPHIAPPPSGHELHIDPAQRVDPGTVACTRPRGPRRQPPAFYAAPWPTTRSTAACTASGSTKTRYNEIIVTVNVDTGKSQ
jgi:hypothetical protein